MSENGTGHKSVVGNFFALVEDQLDLATLELDYEVQHNAKRLAVLAIAVCLIFSAFLISQVAIVFGIAALGISIGWACAALAGLYLLIAVVLIAKFVRRDPKVGMPFQGSRQELKKNLKWIEQLFS